MKKIIYFEPETFLQPVRPAGAEIDYVPPEIKRRYAARLEGKVAVMGEGETEKLLKLLDKSIAKVDTDEGDTQFGGIVHDANKKNVPVLGRKGVRHSEPVVTGKVVLESKDVHFLVAREKPKNAEEQELREAYRLAIAGRNDQEIARIAEQFSPYFAVLEAEQTVAGQVTTRIDSPGDPRQTLEEIQELKPAPLLTRLAAKRKFKRGVGRGGVEVGFFGETDVPATRGLLGTGKKK